MTKQLSARLVAAKARRRREREGELEARPTLGKCFTPRLTPDFTITIRTRAGERLRIQVTRFGKQFITDEGVKTARELERGIGAILRYA